MTKKVYSDEFKLEVIKEYYSGNLGVRLLARKYNLPSKNYISNWISELITKGLIDANLKPPCHKSPIKTEINSTKTAYERQLERENLELRAELAFIREYKRLTDEENKKKHT